MSTSKMKELLHLKAVTTACSIPLQRGAQLVAQLVAVCATVGRNRTKGEKILSCFLMFQKHYHKEGRLGSSTQGDSVPSCYFCAFISYVFCRVRAHVCGNLCVQLPQPLEMLYFA